MHKRHIHIAAILLGCLVIAAVAVMFIKGEELKSLVVGQKSASTAAQSTAMPTVTLSINEKVILIGEPGLGVRVEKELRNGVEIGKIKLQNNGAESIALDEIKFADRGFATNAPVYELFVSKENSEQYEKIGNSSGTPEFKLDSPLKVAAGTYRSLSVRIKSAEGLEKGNIFMLELKSLGSLGLGQNGTMRLGAVMMK